MDVPALSVLLSVEHSLITLVGGGGKLLAYMGSVRYSG